MRLRESVIKYRAERYAEGRNSWEHFVVVLFCGSDNRLSVSLPFFWAKVGRGKGAVKVHVVLEHDGYLPTYVSLSEGSRHGVSLVRGVPVSLRCIVALEGGGTTMWCSAGGRRQPCFSSPTWKPALHRK